MYGTPQYSEWSDKSNDMEVTADDLQDQTNHWNVGHDEVKSVHHK